MTLGLDESEASELHLKYYTQYGLALRGLTGHHDVGEAADSNLSRRVRSLTDETDPLDFDRQCDGALPLEDMLQPSPLIRKLLQDIDRSKARVWALTNAYSPVRPLLYIFCATTTV